jgi:hypothetical protein
MSAYEYMMPLACRRHDRLRAAVLNAYVVKTVTAAYLVIEQTRRELIMLGATRLQNPDNDQLWLPARSAPDVVRLKRPR